MADARDPRTDEQPVLNTTQARQGRRGRHALWIFVISFGVIAVIYGAMVIGVQGTRLSSHGGQTTVDRAALKEAGGFQLDTHQVRETERDPAASPDIQPSQRKQETPVAR